MRAKMIIAVGTDLSAHTKKKMNNLICLLFLFQQTKFNKEMKDY